MQHLEDHGLLADTQLMWLQGKALLKTQLQTPIDELLQWVAKGEQYELAIMDLIKAFDVIPHKRLLEKLQYYGIKGPCLDWMEDFLKNRTQMMVNALKKQLSVPQGSVLGPILLLAFTMTCQSTWTKCFMLPTEILTKQEQ